MVKMSTFIKDKVYAAALTEGFSRTRESFRVALAAEAEAAAEADVVVCGGGVPRNHGDAAAAERLESGTARAISVMMLQA